MWIVRAGRGSENIEDFLKHGIVALGDPQLGPVALTIKKDELLKLYAEKFPAEKEASRAVWASQILRFITELKTGDEVATADRERRRYLLGRILSDYEWAPNLIAEMPHTRRVQWTKEVSRDLLTPATKNTLGSSLTLFKVNADVDKELHAHAVSIGAAAPASASVSVPVSKKEAEEAEIEEEQLANDYLARANEFIEDAIDALDWLQIEHLMAGILRSMGYRTTISEGGPDRGVDIFASPDGLGLEEPRIFVEVKHRTQVIGSKEIRAFLGGRTKGDKCLYVSTGGFTKDAKYEAERAETPTTLIDRQMLRKLLVEHYERLDAETRALVPLKRLYWPVAKK